ncbi:MAG: sulfite exporter TauE/SafE family protein [Ilumatobacteraceae bacterium]
MIDGPRPAMWARCASTCQDRPVQWWEAVLLVLGGVAAGLINAVAGGGSILTVPLLVLAGVPGNNANGSNRVGILTSNAAAATAFRKLGVGGLSKATPILIPIIVGSLVGSYGITRLTDDSFERVFGLVMLPVIFLSIRKPKVKLDADPWPLWLTSAVFFAVGLYGGAVQAGVGLIMLAALTRAGYDLVTANNIKVVANLTLTAVALPVFIVQGNVRWLQALILAAGLTAGSWVGAHAAVRGGERFIRTVMVIAALLLAGNLLGVYTWVADRF